MKPLAPAIRTVRKGMLYIALGAMLWAVIEALGALVSDRHDALQVVWVRYLTHLGFLVVVFAPRRGTSVVRTDRLRLQIARGLLMLLMPLCFLSGVALSSVDEVLSVFWIAPVLTMVLAALLLREQVDAWCWPVVLGGWAGVLFLQGPGGSVLGAGTLPALGMALCLSLYLVLTRLLRDESTLTNLVFTAACVLVPLSLVVPGIWSVPTLRTIVVMAAIGVIGLGALYTLDRATELAPVSAVVPMLYTQPVWLFVLALFVGDTYLGPEALLGMVLIFLTLGAFFAVAGRSEGSPATGGSMIRPVAGLVTGEPRDRS